MRGEKEGGGGKRKSLMPDKAKNKVLGTFFSKPVKSAQKFSM